jgi:hypothetical protein
MGKSATFPAGTNEHSTNKADNNSQNFIFRKNQKVITMQEDNLKDGHEVGTGVRLM